MTRPRIRIRVTARGMPSRIRCRPRPCWGPITLISLLASTSRFRLSIDGSLRMRQERPKMAAFAMQEVFKLAQESEIRVRKMTQDRRRHGHLHPSTEPARLVAAASGPGGSNVGQRKTPRPERQDPDQHDRGL